MEQENEKQEAREKMKLVYIGDHITGEELMNMTFDPEIVISKGLLEGNGLSIFGSNDHKALESFVKVWMGSVLSGTGMLGHETEQRIIIESDLYGSDPLFEHRRFGDTTTYIGAPCFCERGTTRLDDLVYYLAVHNDISPWVILHGDFAGMRRRKVIRGLTRLRQAALNSGGHVTLLVSKDIDYKPGGDYAIESEMVHALGFDRCSEYMSIDTDIFLYTYENMARLITASKCFKDIKIDLSFSRDEGSICRWRLLKETPHI